MFLLQNDLSGILNYYTFTMVPSMINENVKKCAVPLDCEKCKCTCMHCNLKLSTISTIDIYER
jgi:hypothetical protein